MNISDVVEHLLDSIFMATKIRGDWEGFEHKRPKQPYLTVEVLEPYLPQSEGKNYKYVSTPQGLERHSADTFDVLLQFKLYSDSEAKALNALQLIQRYFSYKGRKDLQKIDVAYVEMSKGRGLMEFDEDSKEVIKTFDLKIRLNELIVDEVEWFDRLNITMRRGVK